MARIPTKQMEQAVEKICKNPSTDYVIFGKNKEHLVVHQYDRINLTHIWQYSHYNTLCCQVEFVEGRRKIRVKIGVYAWSQTDSNNINGFLHCLEVPRLRVYRHNDDIHFTIDGVKSKYKSIIIEGEYVYY